MKLIAQLFAATALLAGLNHAFAADGRKEATIDLGKGAFKLTVSVPEGVDGPYDFSKNKGPRVNINKDTDGKGYAYGEVMYNARTSETGGVIYQAAAKKNFNANPEFKGAMAESMAKTMINESGFESPAVRFNCPPMSIEGSVAVCYKMVGDKVFDGKKLPNKYSAILMAVSFANDTMAYSIMGTAVESSIAKFNADPESLNKLAESPFVGLFKYHSMSKN